MVLAETGWVKKADGSSDATGKAAWVPKKNEQAGGEEKGVGGGKAGGGGPCLGEVSDVRAAVLLRQESAVYPHPACGPTSFHTMYTTHTLIEC